MNTFSKSSDVDVINMLSTPHPFRPPYYIESDRLAPEFSPLNKNRSKTLEINHDLLVILLLLDYEEQSNVI